MTTNFIIRLACLATVALTAACASAPPSPAFDSAAFEASRRAAAAPDAEGRLEADLAWLADDDREGREAGTRGYLDAAGYVAARFEATGLSPGADGGWFQSVPLRASRRDLAAAEMTLIAPDGKETPLVHLEDYLIGRPLAAESFNVTAPLLFAGYGVVDPASERDDYAGVDARGKIVVVFNGAPATYDSERRAHFGSTAVKKREAARRGAVGFVTMDTAAGEQRRPWSRMVANPEATGMTWIGADGAADVGAPEVEAGAFMSAAGAEKLFAGAPRPYAELRKLEEEGAVLPSFDLAARARIKGAARFESLSSPNVVGVLEGADPMLRHEAVVLTAHLDGLGVRDDGGDEDLIRNGALDNAMGAAILIEVARSFGEGPPPRRSVYFLAVTAEEKGLLGADYFAHFPTTEGKRIVANVNLDMPLTLFDFEDVVAFGAERSSLGPIAAEAAEAMGLTLSPDPMPEQGIFTRSDHYRFVEKGVPAIYLFIGFGAGGEEVFADFIQNRYHRPSDDLSQPIDYRAAARFAALNALIARRVADDDDTPRWNEGDFFGELFGAGAAAP